MASNWDSSWENYLKSFFFFFIFRTQVLGALSIPSKKRCPEGGGGGGGSVADLWPDTTGFHSCIAKNEEKVRTERFAFQLTKMPDFQISRLGNAPLTATMAWQGPQLINSSRTSSHIHSSS